MGNRKPYMGKLTGHSAWVFKAIGLVVASAAVVIVAVAIMKGFSRDPGRGGNGRFVGVRHEVASIPSAAEAFSSISAPGEGPDQEPSGETVMRNGLTIVSPPLLVPVIDLDSLRPVNLAEDRDSFRKATARKRSHYARRSHPRRHRVADDRWPAFGLAIR